MDFLESEIKRVQPLYSLETTLSDIVEIDQWKAQLMRDTLSRLSLAPSKETSLLVQIEELKTYLVYDHPEEQNPPPSDDFYLNKYRKIAYNHLAKGDNLTLRGLGYVFFSEHWNRSGDEEQFVNVTIINNDVVRIRLNALAEGAAFAHHLPFLEKLLKEITQPAPGHSEDNSLGFYAQIAHQLYTGKMTVGDVTYSDPISFIEAKRMTGKYHGKKYFNGLLQQIPALFGDKAGDTPAREIIDYCKGKLTDDSPAEQMLELFDRPDLQIKLDRENRAKIETLDLATQQGHYEALYRHFVQERRDFLSAHQGSTDLGRLQYYQNFYHAQIEDAKMELDRIAREMGSTLIPFNTPLDTSDQNKRLYRDIIASLYTGGKYIEKYSSLYMGKNEEQIRDVFLFGLNMRQYNAAIASGETFNKKGKTDIILKSVSGDNLFVAECKVWRSPKELSNAIDQLIDRYITWRDTKAALLIFVEEGNFSAILSKVKENATAHQYFMEAIPGDKDTSFPFVFRHQTDPDRKIAVELMVFHLPKIPIELRLKQTK